LDYELTKHARDVLEERDIPIEFLERALKYPELIEPDRYDNDLEHRLIKIPENANRILRIIINIRATPIRIISVYYDRTMRGKL